MQRTSLQALLCGVALAAAAARGVQAQLPSPPTVKDCDTEFLSAPPPADLDAYWRDLYPTRQEAALAPLTTERRWLDALDAVRASFDRAVQANFHGPHQGDARVARFRLRHDSLRARVSRLLTIARAEDFANDRDDLRRVGPAVFRAEMREGEAFFFRGTGEEFKLTDADSLGARRTLCYHAAVESAVLDLLTKDARTAAAAVLAVKQQRWETYFARGYSQLPWELYLNSRQARTAGVLDPPTTQWILLHPSVAVEVSGRSYRDLSRHDAIAIEPLGHIWYRDNYDSYFALSTVVVFANGAGTGAGPFLHFGRVAKLGYVFPLRRNLGSGAGRPGGVLVTVDLYKYLSDRASQVQGVVKELRQKLEKP